MEAGKLLVVEERDGFGRCTIPKIFFISHISKQETIWIKHFIKTIHIISNMISNIQRKLIIALGNWRVAKDF